MPFTAKSFKVRASKIHKRQKLSNPVQTKVPTWSNVLTRRQYYETKGFGSLSDDTMVHILMYLRVSDILNSVIYLNKHFHELITCGPRFNVLWKDIIQQRFQNVKLEKDENITWFETLKSLTQTKCDICESKVSLNQKNKLDWQQRGTPSTCPLCSRLLCEYCVCCCRCMHGWCKDDIPAEPVPKTLLGMSIEICDACYAWEHTEHGTMQTCDECHNSYCESCAIGECLTCDKILCYSCGPVIYCVRRGCICRSCVACDHVLTCDICSNSFCRDCGISETLSGETFCNFCMELMEYY